MPPTLRHPQGWQKLIPDKVLAPVGFGLLSHQATSQHRYLGAAELGSCYTFSYFPGLLPGKEHRTNRPWVEEGRRQKRSGAGGVKGRGEETRITTILAHLVSERPACSETRMDTATSKMVPAWIRHSEISRTLVCSVTPLQVYPTRFQGPATQGTCPQKLITNRQCCLGGSWSQALWGKGHRAKILGKRGGVRGRRMGRDPLKRG